LGGLARVLALVLAGWSLVDAVRYARTGDVRKATLGLPRAVKERIHRVIRAGWGREVCWRGR